MLHIYNSFEILLTRLFERINADDPAEREKKLNQILNFTELCYAVVPSLFLIINNITLVLCIGYIMGTSPSTLDLVQNFIAVEILVQAHSIIAKLMR